MKFPGLTHPVLVAVVSSIFGGTAAVSTRYLVSYAEPLLVTFLRYAIAMLVVAAFAGLAPWRRVADRDQLRILGLGVISFGLMPWSFSVALAYAPAAYGAIAFNTMPVMTLVISVAVGTEKLSPAKALGVGAALLGVCVALADHAGGAADQVAIGVLYMLGAAVCGAVFNVYSRPYFKLYPSLWVTSIAMVGGVAALLPVNLVLVNLGELVNLPFIAWVVAIYQGVFASALTWVLWNFALQRTTPTRVAVTVAASPIAAVLTGAIFLDEAPGSLIVPGIALIAAGIWLVARPTAGSKATAPHAPHAAHGTRD